MLVNARGERISDNDLSLLGEMLSGSIEGHIQDLEKRRKGNPAFVNPIIEVFRKMLEGLFKLIQDAMESDKQISVTDFVQNFYSELGKDIQGKINIENDRENMGPPLYVNWGEENLYKDLIGEGHPEKDKAEGYEKTAGEFHFSGNKLDGIEDIVDYDPDKDRVKDLYEGRTGNSTTLRESAESLRKRLNDLPANKETKEERKELKQRIDEVEKASFGLNAAAEVARVHSSNLRGKKGEVTFGDVYQAYSEINQFLRPGDPDGGKLRGNSVMAGKLYGVGSFVVPLDVIKTMQTIADGINEIKKTDDPALRKSMAIELSAFAYQMTMSEHSFSDGNGRTCRLFADTILQTFGLPPYTPMPEENDISKTMGEKMDFAKGAEVFLAGVKKSSDILVMERELEAKNGVIGEPGEITARFRDFIKKHEELSSRPVPDALNQPDQYLKHRSSLRADQRQMNAFKRALSESKISRRQWERAYFAVTGKMPQRRMFPSNDKLLDFVRALEIRMTEEEKKDVTDQLNAWQDAMSLPKEQQVTHPSRKRIEELKKNIPADIANDPDLKARYESALDYADQHLTRVKDDVHEELDAAEKDSQHLEAVRDNNIRDNLLLTYEGGKYAGLITKDENSNFITVPETKREGYEEVLNDGITLSEKTKEGIRLIIQKMDEMGLYAYPYAANGEDGTKIYSFNKLVHDREELRQAIEEGHPGRIMMAQKAYDQTVRDTEELFRIAKDHFSNEPGLYPGNMDSIRNRAVPFEFAGDLHTAAQINSVFLTYINVKTNGVKLEEYLNNPIRGLVKDAFNKYKSVSFQKVSQNLSIEQTMDLLAGVGDFKSSHEKIGLAVPQYLLIRQIGTPNLLETDENLKKKNGVFAHVMNNDIINEAVREGQSVKFMYFRQKKKTPESDRHAFQTLKNIMLAKDEDRNLNAMFDGMPETDLLGRKIGNGFNAAEYIKQKPVDYAGIMNRASRMMRRSEQYEVKAWFNQEDRLLRAAVSLYQDVLQAHPEDANKAEYRKMQEEMNRAYDKIASAEPENARKLTQGRKDAANEMLKESRLNYRIAHEPEKYLSELEKEAVRTGDYRKYAEGLIKAQMHDLLIRNTWLDNPDRPRTVEEKRFRESFDKYLDEKFEWDKIASNPKRVEIFMKTGLAISSINVVDSYKAAKESVELARRIRKGEVEVDPAYADMYLDVHASQMIANQILTGGEMDLRMQAASTLKGFYSMALPYEINVKYVTDSAKEGEIIIQRGNFGKNASERAHMIALAQAGFATSPVEYGMTWNAVDGIETKTKRGGSIKEGLEHSFRKIDGYYSNVKSICFDASEKLRIMDRDELGGRDGSDQYKAMCDALKKVTELSSENTPLQVDEALRNLGDKAEAYKEKIDKQREQNRYQMAESLIEFSKNNCGNLAKQSVSMLDPDEKIGAQRERAINNLEQHEKKQSQLQQNAPVNEVKLPGDQNVPVNEVKLPEDQNVPVQQVKGPEDQKVPKKKVDKRRKLSEDELEEFYDIEDEEDENEYENEYENVARRSMPAEKNGKRRMLSEDELYDLFEIDDEEVEYEGRRSMNAGSKRPGLNGESEMAEEKKSPKLKPSVLS